MITFEDSAVEAICLANYDTDGNGVLMKSEAEAVTDMSNTFLKNTEIISFDELEQFTNLESLGTRVDAPGSSNYGTFSGCTSLVSVKLPSSVKQLGSYAFYGCSALEDVGSLANVETVAQQTFYQCANLSMVVNMPKLTLRNGGAIFYGSGITGVGNLGSANLGGGWNAGIFQNCTSLRFAILPSSVTNITGNDFSGCTAMQTLIMRNESPCTLGSLPTNIVSIYVPDASVDAYKEASGWSTYAAKIKPMSSVTSDALYSEFEEYL